MGKEFTDDDALPGESTDVELGAPGVECGKSPPPWHTRSAAEESRKRAERIAKVLRELKAGSLAAIARAG